MPTLSKSRKLLVLAALLVTAIFLLLYFAARTPRGRLNIVQVVAALFFVISLIRHRKVDFRPGVGQGAGVNANARGLWLGLPIALGAIAWSAMIPLSFVSDDYALLYNAHGPMAQGVWEMLTRGQAGLFLRPAGFASIFLDYRLFHGWAAGYHLVNLVIHLVAVAGLFRLCECLGMQPAAAGTAALLFAAMPVQVEAIAWLGARFDQLSACLTIWTVVLYLKFRKQGGRVYYLAALLSFLLAALSKENAYSLPLLLAAAEVFILRDRQVKPAAGFFLLAGALFVYRWAVLGGIGGYANGAGQPATFDIGIKTLQGLFLRGPAQMLMGLNWVQPPVLWITVLASLIGAILLVLALAAAPDRDAQSSSVRRLLFALCWMLFTMLPAHSVLLIGADLVNSRVLYLGTAGLAIFIAQVIFNGGNGAAALRWTGTIVLVALLVLGVLHNLAAWRSVSGISSRFFSQLHQLEPSPPPNAVFVFRDMPHSIAGVYFLHAGLPEAIKTAYGRDDLKAVREEELPPATTAENPTPPHIRFDWRGGEDLLLTPIAN